MSIEDRRPFPPGLLGSAGDAIRGAIDDWSAWAAEWWPTSLG